MALIICLNLILAGLVLWRQGVVRTRRCDRWRDQWRFKQHSHVRVCERGEG